MIEIFSQLTVPQDSLFLTHWAPSEKKATAVIILAHGMAEHTARYREFAQRLTENGFTVYAHDHRGHGRSVTQKGIYGHFGDHDGWNRALTDLDTLVSHATKNHPGLPVFLYGHSMGSFLVRDLVVHTKTPLKGAIISGTAHLPSLLTRAGQWIAECQIRCVGPRAPSHLMNRLTFGVYNLCVVPARTPFDWICSDPESVDRYINDPLCGYISTTAFFRDMTFGLTRIGRKAHIKKTPGDLPLLFLAGKKDPVATMGHAATTLAARYRAAGSHDTQVILYEGARHELFGEPIKESVYSDIIQWIETRRL